MHFFLFFFNFFTALVWGDKTKTLSFLSLFVLFLCLNIPFSLVGDVYGKARTTKEAEA